MALQAEMTPGARKSHHLDFQDAASFSVRQQMQRSLWLPLVEAPVMHERRPALELKKQKSASIKPRVS